MNRTLCAALLTLISCGGSGPRATPAPENELAGGWSVRVRFTRGEGTLASLVNTELSGRLTIERTSRGYTITDGVFVEPLSVTGNYASFSYIEDGVTQIWSFHVAEDNASMAGYVLVRNEGYTAEGTLTGSRIVEPARTIVTTTYELEDALVITCVRVR